MNNDSSLLDVLKILGRWKKHILRATIAAAILSVIGTLMMPNWYESSATFYAAHSDLGKPDPVGGGETNKYIYGTSDDMDRLFSLANSSEIRSELIQKFNLYDHYKIDSTSRKGKAKMANKFNDLFKTLRTEYDAMVLSMEDTDPILATKIIEHARELLSKKTQSLIKESQLKAITSIENNISNQIKELGTLNDSIVSLKTRYGIYDSNTQGEVFASMITETNAALEQKKGQLKSLLKSNATRDTITKVRGLISGLSQKQTTLQKADSLYSEGILLVTSLEKSQKLATDELALEQERYKRLKISYESPFTALHMVEKETVPVEKSRPKRSIIVLGLTLLTFILCSLGAIVIESTKDINWRDIYNG